MWGTGMCSRTPERATGLNGAPQGRPLGGRDEGGSSRAPAVPVEGPSSGNAAGAPSSSSGGTIQPSHRLIPGPFVSWPGDVRWSWSRPLHTQASPSCTRFLARTPQIQQQNRQGWMGLGRHLGEVRSPPALDPDRCRVSGQHERAVPVAVRHQLVALCRLGEGWEDPLWSTGVDETDFEARVSPVL